MVKVKAKEGQIATAVWLPKARYNVIFKNGVAEVPDDKKILAELKSVGYQVSAETATVETPKVQTVEPTFKPAGILEKESEGNGTIDTDDHGEGQA